MEPGIDQSLWYSKPPGAALEAQGVTLDEGLNSDEAAARLRTYGPNELTEQKARSPLRILAEQFASTIIVVLIVAAAVSGAMGNIKDAIAIMAIVVLNALLGLLQEYRAEQAMAALRKMATPTVRVRRDRQTTEISATKVVPGDVLFLETGNLVPADGRILEEANLRVQESALTGESEAVEKDAGALTSEDIPLGDRSNMVFRGTWVTYGRGSILVTATGMATELGKIATLLQGVERQATPLQKRLAQLGHTLVTLSLVIAALIFVLGYLRGESFDLLFMTAVSIAVAAIPEGLPAVVTIALALGAQRMLRRRALIRKLPAVETLGSVTVICSDKTGTLTENRMTVTMLDVANHRIDLSEHLHRTTSFIDTSTPDLKPISEAPALKLLLAGGALCNDAELQKPKAEGERFHAIGEPTETALTVAAARLGFCKPDVEKRLPRIAELPFDSERKRMSTLQKIEVRGEVAASIVELLGSEPEAVVFAKGAVDGLLEVCDRVVSPAGIEELDQAWRGRITSSHDELAAQGVRVLGFAWRPAETSEAAADLEHNLIFVGFFGIIDPPRPEVRQAILTCREAGIRPVMITGDHPATARSIAEDLCIAERATSVEGRELERMSDQELLKVAEVTSVFARVSPEHKLRIVTALQQRGHVVAMTGDGVNDAPALRRADIGVAMGITGTDVSREAAHMVLLDDNFTTIVSAVEEGRTIFENIRKFVKYSVAGNLGKILVVLLAPLLLMPLPLTPLQILWLNLLTDGLLGLGLSVEPSEPGIMTRKPIPKTAPFFSGKLLRQIIVVGVLIGGVSLGYGYWAWSGEKSNWQTLIFTTIAIAQVWQALAVRTNVQSLFKVGLRSNRPLLGAVLLVLILQALVIYVPAMQGVFGTRPLGAGDLGISILLGSSVFVLIEARKWQVRRIDAQTNASQRYNA